MYDSDSEGAFRPALFTDLYELTMAQAYDAEKMDDVAVISLGIAFNIFFYFLD